MSSKSDLRAEIISILNLEKYGDRHNHTHDQGASTYWQADQLLALIESEKQKAVEDYQRSLMTDSGIANAIVALRQLEQGGGE